MLPMRIGALVGAVVACLALTATAGAREFVFGAENNRLDAYDAVTLKKHVVIRSEADDHARGLDINAQICFVPDSVSWKPRGQIWFVAGEDTEQNAKPGIIRQGWGLFRLRGHTLETLSATEVGKLVPDSYVTSDDNPENYGCGVLPDGRLLTGDVGDQLPTGPATGQLIEWFPRASMFKGPIGPTRFDFRRVPHCKIDVGIGTAGGMLVDGDTVYLASNRPNLQSGEIGGIYKYDTTGWPGSERATDGCDHRDQSGARMADPARSGKTLFIPQGPFALTPSDIIDSGHETFYVSSVFSGTIAEYDRTGTLVRMLLVSLGQLGGITPYGLGVTGGNALWIADIGVVGTGPAAAGGSVVRLPLHTDGTAGPPREIDSKLEFPDGIGVVDIPPRRHRRH